MKSKSIVTAFLVTSLAFSWVSVVGAQEEPAPSASSDDIQGIFQQESLRPEIERLKISYRGMIEDYRNKERQYQIAKADYQQLKTLRSLEEAIRATREAIISRTDVLLTYFELLRLELQESEGIESQRKTRALSEIEAEIRYLRDYKEQALAAQNREQVLALTVTFREHGPIVQHRGHQALSLISIGRLQAVHDKSRLLLTDIQDHLNQQEVSQFVKDQRERGSVQTTQSLELVNTTLNKEITELPPQASRSQYDNLRETLTDTYTYLSQSISYLQELLEL